MLVTRRPGEWVRRLIARGRGVLGALGPTSFARGTWRRPTTRVEPRVRRVVAERLGVDPGELAPEVSLTDDLAADSLDLLDLAIGLEDELAISVPESSMDSVRTYGQLVAVVQDRARERRADAAWLERNRTPPFILARIVPPPSQPPRKVEHAGWLTPYMVETIVDGALRAGAGTRFELHVARNIDEPVMARLRSEFAWLRRRHIAVHIRRDRELPPFSVAG